MLFNIHIFVSFSSILFLMISNFIQLWFENTLYIISVLLNLLWFVSWPKIWSVLENSLCVLEKYTDGCSILQMSIRFSWFIMLFMSSDSLSTFNLVIL